MSMSTSEKVIRYYLAVVRGFQRAKFVTESIELIKLGCLKGYTDFQAKTVHNVWQGRDQCHKI